jgi:Transposase
MGRAQGVADRRFSTLPEQRPGANSIRWWLSWVDRSRLEPFRKLSRTLKEHFHGILAYLEIHLTNAAIEAVTASSRWLSASPVASVTSITSESPLISKPAVLTSKSLTLYPLETSKRPLYAPIVWVPSTSTRLGSSPTDAWMSKCEKS